MALFQHPRTSVSLHNLFMLYSLFSPTSKALVDSLSLLPPLDQADFWVKYFQRIRSRGHLCAKWSLCTEVVWWNKRLRQCRCFCTVTVFSWSGMGAGLSTSQVGGCDKTSSVVFSSGSSAPACSFLHSSFKQFRVLQRIKCGFMFDKGILNECTNGYVHTCIYCKIFPSQRYEKMHKIHRYAIYPPPLKKGSHLQSVHGDNSMFS